MGDLHTRFAGGDPDRLIVAKRASPKTDLDRHW